MKTITKPYSPELNQNYGDPAELAVIKWLQSRNAVQEVIRYPYGVRDVDLLIITQVGYVFYADVERRENWTHGRFPFETIHIPYRKRKFVEGREPFLYYAVRHDLRAFAKITGYDISQSGIIVNENKFVQDRERFYSIDAIKIQHIFLNGRV